MRLIEVESISGGRHLINVERIDVISKHIRNKGNNDEFGEVGIHVAGYGNIYLSEGYNEFKKRLYEVVNGEDKNRRT